MECHPRALLTLSQSNGIQFCPNIPVRDLIKRVTRAVEASDVSSAPSIVETTDGVMHVSTKDAWQSTEGYPAMVDLSMVVRVIRNRMVTQGAETAI